MAEPAATLRHIDEGVFGRGVLPLWRPHGVLGRVGLVLAAVTGCAIFRIGSSALHVPELPGFDGSLLHQDAPVSALIGIAVLLFAATIVGTFVAGRARFEAGLLAATAGLMMVSGRTGNIQSVLQESSGTAGVYAGLMGELVILGLMLAGMWGILLFFGSKGMMKAVVDEDGTEDISDSWEKLQPVPVLGDAVKLTEFLGRKVGAKVMALVVQVVVMGLVMMLLCQSNGKNQALASVAIASFLGTMAGYAAYGARPSIWFWVGPIIVGIIGYGIAAMGFVGGLKTGVLDGTFAGLARPLPLDYASVGPAMAMVGYWTFHKRG